MSNSNATICFVSTRIGRPHQALENVGPESSGARKLTDSQAISSPRRGWSTCSKCPCAGFVQSWANSNICERCGHSYGEHW